MSALYQSAWHHPGIAWASNALLLLCFTRVVPRELRLFSAVALAEIVLDAFFTGAFSPLKTGSVAQAIAIGFVIAGDLRYFYLVERDYGTEHPLLVSTLLAFVVPVAQTVMMKWVLPGTFNDGRLVFLSYEATFVLFAALMWVFRHGRAANRWRTGVFAFEIVQYVLWASIDVLLVSGQSEALLLRIIPNTLYYAGFLWFVVLSWRR